MIFLRFLIPLVMISLSFLPLFAGGPIGGVGVTPTAYSTDRFPLHFATDKGNLGTFNNSQATSIAIFSFTEWDNLVTALLSFTNQGQLDRDVTSATDPYISGVEQFADGVFPVIFDTDGSITDARIGVGARQQIYGFASSFSLDGITYEEGFVIINGVLTSRQNVEPVYREVITHEIGHMLGISHSQIGMSADYSLMYPTPHVEAGGGIEPDDATAMSLLYPAPGYLSSVGSISGTITNSSGAPLSGMNMIAVDSATGNVYSSVSDYYSGDDGRFFSKPDRTGEYTIRGLPPGRYFVRMEPVNPIFTNGSQVASYLTPINTGVWHDWYNGAGEDGNMLIDNSNERTSVIVTAGAITEGIDLQANDSPTLTTLTEHTATVSQEFIIPLEPTSGVTISRIATRYTAPQNGSVLGVRLWTQANSELPPDATLTVSVHRDVAGSLAGVPGTELGSVTIPFSQLAADQYNDIWLRGIGTPVNFFQGEKFHVAVRVSGGVLSCLLDDANGTKNQTSYFRNEAGRWFNFPDGLSGSGLAGWNLFMSAIYTSVPAGVEAPLIDAPSLVAFSTTRIGVKTTKNVVVRNVGTADLNVTNALITGTNGSRFSIESGGGAFTLTPGASRTLVVGFTPEEGARVTALLQFMHNATGSPTVVNLSGAGKQPVIVNVTTSIEFGEQQITRSSQQEPTIFRNDGTDSLRVTSVEIDGEGFTLASPSGAAWVGPAGSFKARVSFRPTEERAYSGMLRIRHELGSSPIEVPLSGIGVASVGAVSTDIVAGGFSLSLAPIQPNPVRGEATLVWQTHGTGRLPVEIIITDIPGRMLYREEREIVGAGGTGRESLVLDLRDVPSGEYQALIRSSRGSATQRFVVVK